MMFNRVGADISVLRLRPDQFFHSLLDHIMMLACGTVSVSEHGRSEPFTPEFTSESPMFVIPELKRSHQPFNIMSHHPVVDAEIHFFTHIAPYM
ncbi:hypothetical protein SDC9_198705 [bioreactor metagenome]|uniref:Uncharacterized protein n=1 Tax=bioreactor metagenome TaxID=1076179 RepID=A0A645IRN8_9ZZZZ